MRAIACVDQNWGIGKEGRMLFHLPGDLRYFAAMTRGKTVVMGRKTLETLPGGRPLAGRRNLVLTRDPGFCVPGAEAVHSLAVLDAAVRGTMPDDILVIGGQAVYELLLPRCDRAYITRVKACAASDRFFPNLDELPGWRLADCGPGQAENGLRYAFCVYERSGGAGMAR